MDQRTDQAALGETGSIIDLGLPAPAAPSTSTTRRTPRSSATACTAASACRPVRPTSCGARRWTAPAGRIYLMKEGLEGEPMTDEMVSHWDACLGCMACVTACPSGVQYDKLIESTRAQVERNHERSAGDKALRGLIFSLFPHPRRLQAAARSAARAAGHRAGPGAAAYRPARAHGAPARGDGEPRPAPRLARAAAALHRGLGAATRRRRHAHRLCPGRLLPRRELRDGPGAPGGGVRRRRPAVAGLLRCAVGAQRPRGGGAEVRPPAHRLLRGRRASSGSSSTRPGAAPR